MSDDLPVAGDPGRQAGMLASDQERERATQTLAAAAGDGRLTPAELDERLEAALTARTSGDLAKLTADLPEVGGTPRDLLRLDVSGGATRRQGRWIVPRRMEIRASGGSVRLDFTEAVITGPTLEIQTEMSGGRLLVVTRPGIQVEVDEMSAHGGRVRVRPERDLNQAARLVIRISGEARGGQILARPRRKWSRRGRRSSTP